MIGETYGHYRILSRLGGGGMGDVYLAEDERLGRKVALKFLAPDMARSEEAVIRFQNEARVAAGLSHANIAAIHGFDQHEDRWFHVHEYVEGETLEQHLAAGPLSIDDARHYLIDLARGLGHAHARGVIHRDIKPANVMITPEGVAKILDFGLARRSGTEGQTMPGVAVGTVAYMSPEQIRGETVDARSDLWSLGVLSYQCLTGTLPFAAPEMAAQMHRILSEEPRPANELRPEVPADLEACVERCLRKAREERFARAEDLLASMGVSSSSRSGHSIPAVPAQAPKESPSRRPLTMVAGVAVVVLAALGLWYGLRGDGPSDQAGGGSVGGSPATGGPGSTDGSGPVAETVTVRDEFGQVTEQRIADSQYRQKVSIFLTDVDPTASEDQWLAEGMALLVNMDLAQDPFVVAATALEFIGRAQREGVQDPRKLSSSQKRKIARDRMSPWFVTSKLTRTEAGDYRLEQTLHATESGRATNTRVIESSDLFELADAASIAIREDLDIPEVLADEYPDLPVEELFTDSIDACHSFVLAARALIVNNDYETADGLLETAVAADSTFAMAHFFDFAVSSLGQDTQGMQEAGELMMRYAYRLPTKFQYAVKANYYLNVEMEPDKAFAVTRMWTQLHPEDEDGYRQLAAFHELRDEREEQIAALKEQLRIDPSNYAVLHTIARVYQELGQFDQAAEWMLKYVEAYPERADGYEELAQLYVDTGDRDAALDQYERAMLLDERRTNPYLGIASIQLREGRFDEANAQLDQAARIASSGTDRARVHAQRRDLLERQGRIHAALEEQDMYLTALSLDIPPMQVQLNSLGELDLYPMIGQTDRGLEIALAIKAELSDQVKSAAALGTVGLFVALGEADSARTHLLGLEGFIETYRIERIRPVIDLLAAEIADLEGDHARAVELLSSAVQSQPTSASVKGRLGRSLRKAGRIEEAGLEIDAGLALDPADPLLWVERARVDQASGDGQAARENLDRALAFWEGADSDYIEKQSALELQAMLAN